MLHFVQHDATYPERSEGSHATNSILITMKKILTLIFTTFLFSSCAFLENQTLSEVKNNTEETAVNGFVNGSEDIPLLKSLTQVNEEILGFDSSSGSISATNYKSEIDLEKVKNFYYKTLPQLGWKLKEKKLEKIVFIRGNEKVEINFVNENGDDLVKFFISSTL